MPLKFCSEYISHTQEWDRFTHRAQEVFISRTAGTSIYRPFVRIRWEPIIILMLLTYSIFIR